MEFDLSCEWLESNGIGGYASSTVIGCNSRRYHALLCAATHPPVGRMVLVNKLDESLAIAGRHFDLGCNQYPGTINPTGYQFLHEFTQSPLPCWHYAIPRRLSGLARDILLEKTLWMPYGQNTTVVRYTLLEGDDLTLTAHPFVTERDYHGIHHYNTSFDTHCQRSDGDGGCQITLRPYHDCVPIVFSHDGDFYEGGAWYYALEYPIEQERGLDFREDVYCPGAWKWHLTEGGSATLVVSTEPRDVEEMAATWLPETQRRAALRNFASDRADSESLDRLALAADQFVVRRQSDELHTVLAGYHWFCDWGRDTMIALPGLCLTTKQHDIARSILLAFAKAASQGMIPNRFPDSGEPPEYNTVDATLWFFHAVAKYGQCRDDWDTVVNELYPVLRDCIEWHIKGTRYGIVADPNDGLLHSGEPGTQLTWMDAKVNDWVVTPRTGKPVEIQALWFNALRTMTELAKRANDKATEQLCSQWSENAKNHFHDTFWNETADCLFDCVDDSGKDGAIRPNQIFAVSLPHHLLTPEYEGRVVATVQRELLTPYGLRSLSPRDSHYCGIYRGDQTQRDGAYHQGTVWAWLIGPFVNAYLHVNGRSQSARAQARLWLTDLLSHLDEACLGSISEIFDGDPPHTPRGCCAQAWSVAELLRVLAEEVE